MDHPVYCPVHNRKVLCNQEGGTMKRLLLISLFASAIAFGQCSEEPADTPFNLIVSSAPTHILVAAAPIPCDVDSVKFFVTFTDRGGSYELTARIHPVNGAAELTLPAQATDIKVTAQALVLTGQPVTTSFPY
jgi:hypothetical protein